MIDKSKALLLKFKFCLTKTLQIWYYVTCSEVEQYAKINFGHQKFY